jgi:pentapeptide MXKDX repeat protein
MKKVLSIVFAGCMAVAAAGAFAQDAKKDAMKKDSMAKPMDKAAMDKAAMDKPIDKALAEKEAMHKDCMIKADMMSMGKDGKQDPKVNKDALLKDCMDKKKGPMKKEEPKK